MAALRVSTLISSQVLRSCLKIAPVYSRNYSASKFDPPVDSVDEPQIHIPPYTPRHGEPVDVIKARLLYQSRKRGMLENGLLLSTFASKYLQDMTEEELHDYDRLINLPSNDWDIFYWATGVKPIPLDFDTPIMKKFVNHVRNSDKEARFHQPNLPEQASQ